MNFKTVAGSVLVSLLVISGVAFAEEGMAVKSLYERLGGEAAVTAVVDAFVAKAAADPAVNFTRKGTDAEWEATPENIEVLKKHLVQFIAVAAGATDKAYEGRSMTAVHGNMGISNAEFDAIAGDLKAVLDEFKVPAQEQNELLAAVSATRSQIVAQE